MAKCYMDKVKQNESILHYRRSPSLRSLVVFIIVVLFGWLVALTAANKWLQFCIVGIAIYFAYVSTEKYEECILDKRKQTVTLCSARVIEKILLGYKKLIVSELSQIIGVEVVTFTSKYSRPSHQVCLKFEGGFNLSLTASCTYEDKRIHESLANEVREFLDVPDFERVTTLTASKSNTSKKNNNNYM